MKHAARRFKISGITPKEPFQYDPEAVKALAEVMLEPEQDVIKFLEKSLKKINSKRKLRK